MSNSKQKWFVVNVPEKTYTLKFRPSQLKDDGAMSSEAKIQNFEELLRLIKNELQWDDKSRFVLVKCDNIDIQINDGDGLLHLWNQLNDDHTLELYLLDIVCLIVGREKDALAWFPNNVIGPDAFNDDWEACLEELIEIAKIPQNEYLIDANGNVIKKAKDLKMICLARCRKDQTRWLTMRFVSEFGLAKKMELNMDSESAGKKK